MQSLVLFVLMRMSVTLSVLTEVTKCCDCIFIVAFFSNEYLKFTGYSPKLVSLDVIGQLSLCHVFLEKCLLLRNHDTRLFFF